MESAQVPGDVLIGGVPENEFREAVETLLREGRADEAARRIRDELVFLCGEGQPLPARFRFIGVQDVVVTGWERLVGQIGDLGRAGAPITAIALRATHTDASRPIYRTTYYTDAAYPFSMSDRAALARWQGPFAAEDDALGITGLEDLHAVIAAMRTLCKGGMATVEERRACLVGACHLAVLTHLAVRQKAVAEGLLRPMAVIVGSDGDYPAFEAAALTAFDGVLPLDPGHVTANHFAPGTATFEEGEQSAGPRPERVDDPAAWHLPPPGIHVTGTQLRRRLVTAESIALLDEEQRPSLLSRVLGPLMRKK